MTASLRPPPRSDHMRRTARASLKLWLGVFLGFIAAALGLGALIFIWFGFFPALIAIGLCLPIAALALHFVREGRPPRTV